MGDIVGGFEEAKYVALTLCDLNKAFDCVDHHRLLKKLENYLGFRGHVLIFFCRIDRIKSNVFQPSFLWPFSSLRTLMICTIFFYQTLPALYWRGISLHCIHNQHDILVQRIESLEKKRLVLGFNRINLNVRGFK